MLVMVQLSSSECPWHANKAKPLVLGWEHTGQERRPDPGTPGTRRLAPGSCSYCMERASQQDAAAAAAVVSAGHEAEGPACHRLTPDEGSPEVAVSGCGSLAYWNQVERGGGHGDRHVL